VFNIQMKKIKYRVMGGDGDRGSAIFMFLEISLCAKLSIMEHHEKGTYCLDDVLIKFIAVDLGKLLDVIDVLYMSVGTLVLIPPQPPNSLLAHGCDRHNPGFNAGPWRRDISVWIT